MLGPCVGVTNKGKSGFGKANDRAKAKDHRPGGPQGILGGTAAQWGALSEGENLDRFSLFEGHYRVASLYPKRSSQALIPGPPSPSPCRNNAKSKHHKNLE